MKRVLLAAGLVVAAAIIFSFWYFSLYSGPQQRSPAQLLKIEISTTAYGSQFQASTTQVLDLVAREYSEKSGTDQPRSFKLSDFETNRIKTLLANFDIFRMQSPTCQSSATPRFERTFIFTAADGTTKTFEDATGCFSEEFVPLRNAVTNLIFSLTLAHDNPEWQQALDFASTLPNGTSIEMWWDYGQAFSFYLPDAIVPSEKDNRAPTQPSKDYERRILSTIVSVLTGSEDKASLQANYEHIFATAVAFTNPTNQHCRVGDPQIRCDSIPESLENSELYSLSLLRPARPGYVLIDSEIISGKDQSLQTIADIPLGQIKTLACTRGARNSVSCPLAGYSDEYAGLNAFAVFSADDWTFLTNRSWPGSVFVLQVKTASGAPLNKTIEFRVFGSEDSQGLRVYAAPTSLPAVYSFAARLFFRDQSLKHAELAYENPRIKIYKIDWTGIA